MSEASEVDLVVQEAKKLWRERLHHPDCTYEWQVQHTSHSAYGYVVCGMSADADRIFVSSVMPWGVAQQVLESVQKMEQGHRENPRAVEFRASSEERLRIAAQEIFRDRLTMCRNSRLEWDGSWGPVRREQIRETGGDRSFERVLSKEPYKQLGMDCRDAPPMSRLHRMAEPHGYLSKIPGARNDWAPAQAVTYEQDLGEDLELSDAELRAWAAGRH